MTRALGGSAGSERDPCLWAPISPGVEGPTLACAADADHRQADVRRVRMPQGRANSTGVVAPAASPDDFAPFGGTVDGVGRGGPRVERRIERVLHPFPHVAGKVVDAEW